MALAITIACFWAAEHAARPEPLAVRFVVAAGCATLIASWIALTIGDVARRRFFSEAHLDAAIQSCAASGAFGVARAVQQNTFEQGVLAVIADGATAVLMPKAGAFIVAATALFSVGRLFFWVGYRHGAEARALGFGLTFYPTVGLLILALMHLRSP